jgi:hypothetical protein
LANLDRLPQRTGARELAEEYVTKEFVRRCAFTILTESGARAGSPRTLWEDATMAERQRLLGLVIERIVAIPLEGEVPVNRYR